MIRVGKCENEPRSLAETKSYAGHDVQKQLLQDQQKKCYICECEVDPNYHIEHLDSKNPNKQEWRNLFLSCGYCNERKLGLFDNILNPAENNIEEIIEQRLDTKAKTAKFYSQNASSEVSETIRLLERLFNGKKLTPKLRNPHEEVFYDKVEMAFNDFLRKVLDYCSNTSDMTKLIVQEELTIDKVLLGFKYWIIRDNPQLFSIFKDDIVWNKQ